MTGSPQHEAGTPAARPWRPARRFAGQAETAIWNTLMGWAGQPIRLGAPNRELVFAATAAPAAPGLVAVLEAGAVQLHVLPDVFPFKALCDLDLAAADIAELAPVLQQALVEGMLDFISRQLPASRLGPLRLAGLGTVAALPAGLDWFTLSFHGLAPTPIQLRLGATMASLMLAFGGEGLAAAPVGDALARTLTLDADMVIGLVTLPLGMLRQLRPGDVVVLPEGGAGLVGLRLGEDLHRFSPVPEGWRHEGRQPETGPGTASGPLPELAGWTLPAAPDLAGEAALPIPVELDIGRLRLAVATIEAWQPGAVVPLALPPLPPEAEAPPVTLRVAGRAIAQGDRLQLDDRVAVRITRLFAS